MADRSHKSSNNIDGMFYVDEHCQLCGKCTEIAPDHFRLEKTEAFVYRQPMDQDEMDKCFLAMRKCPCHSIGCDGPCEGRHEQAHMWSLTNNL